MNRLAKIQKEILRWYSREARNLPWRKTRNPYRILLSEVMLQQTQVHRVRQKYPLFLKRFPSLGSLARARTASVIRAWQGMGYNNRAVRLQRLAKKVLYQYNSRLPHAISELESLPGIGPYTSRAVSCFAFGQRVHVVDTNIRRVLQRIFPRESKRLRIWDVAEWALPKRNAYFWNQSLMELGSRICVGRNPRCAHCPVNRFCPSAFKRNYQPGKNGRQEPGRNGIPNRIYRGRIIESLRDSRCFVKASVLGKQIKPDFRSNDRPWLHQLLRDLERDGVVRVKNHCKDLKVSLPR